MIKLLKKEIAKCHTAAKFCALNGVDAGYLSKVLKGNLDPPPPVLAALGLEKIVTVTYRRKVQNEK